MIAKKNQRERIVEYIKANGYITSFDAYTKLGITQLATRIKELKEKEGYTFRTEWETKKGADGGTVSFVRYYLNN